MNVVASPRAYLLDSDGAFGWVRPGTAVAIDVPYGEQKAITWSCCTLDTSGGNCLLNNQTCPEGYCNCAPTQGMLLDADSCSTQRVSICGG